MRVLLTTTSYQDTPGKHQQMLVDSGFEIVRARGPLTEQEMLDLIAEQGPFDALLNGDDHITAEHSAPHQLRLLAVQVTQLLKCAGEIETGLLNADKKHFPITSSLKELCAKGKHWLECGASLHAQVLNQ